MSIPQLRDPMERTFLNNSHEEASATRLWNKLPTRSKRETMRVFYPELNIDIPKERLMLYLRRELPLAMLKNPEPSQKFIHTWRELLDRACAYFETLNLDPALIQEAIDEWLRIDVPELVRLVAQHPGCAKYPKFKELSNLLIEMQAAFPDPVRYQQLTTLLATIAATICDPPKAEAVKSAQETIDAIDQYIVGDAQVDPKASIAIDLEAEDMAMTDVYGQGKLRR